MNPTRISRSKTLRQIQAQMNRIVASRGYFVNRRKISQRMGINPNIISVRFRYNGDYHDFLEGDGTNMPNHFYIEGTKKINFDGEVKMETLVIICDKPENH